MYSLMAVLVLDSPSEFTSSHHLFQSLPKLSVQMVMLGNMLLICLPNTHLAADIFVLWSGVFLKVNRAAVIILLLMLPSLSKFIGGVFHVLHT